MKYPEYLKVAKKHLFACKRIFETYTSADGNETEVWLEIYYLSGYILEGISVYSAYLINEWPENEDIERSYHEEFTNNCGLDFYRVRTDFSKRPIFGKNVVKCSVQGHNFQEIVKNLLRTPTFNNIPYIGDGAIDEDIEKLIDNWKPGLRYMYVTYSDKCKISLNGDIISRLLKTMEIIYNSHI